MGILSALKGAWRKNAAEAKGLWNGAIADFVTAARPRECDGVPVFCYHVVAEEDLEADLSFLARNGYQTLSTSELLDHLSGVAPASTRSVLLAFDDGPRNFYEVVFPLLRNFGARAVAFIAPGLHSETEENPHADSRPMLWPEIREIAASGRVEFQSHTLESRFLPQWPMAAALAGCDPKIENRRRRRTALPFREDLAASVRELETHLPGTQVDQLAFPMYLGTDKAVADARALGFKACYWGLLPGRALNRRGDSPFFISRMSDEFLRRLPGAGRLSMRDLLRQRLRRIEAGRAWRREYPEPVV